MTREQFDEDKEVNLPPHGRMPADSSTKVRTDYRCAAFGCPNAGIIDDTGPGTGRCYYHWREPDRAKWEGITQRIRANFDTMRNHDAES